MKKFLIALTLLAVGFSAFAEKIVLECNCKNDPHSAKVVLMLNNCEDFISAPICRLMKLSKKDSELSTVLANNKLLKAVAKDVKLLKLKNIPNIYNIYYGEDTLTYLSKDSRGTEYSLTTFVKTEVHGIETTTILLLVGSKSIAFRVTGKYYETAKDIFFRKELQDVESITEKLTEPVYYINAHRTFWTGVPDHLKLSRAKLVDLLFAE